MKTLSREELVNELEREQDAIVMKLLVKIENLNGEIKHLRDQLQKQSQSKCEPFDQQELELPIITHPIFDFQNPRSKSVGISPRLLLHTDYDMLSSVPKLQPPLQAHRRIGL